MATSTSEFGPIFITYPDNVGEFGVNTTFSITLADGVTLDKKKARSVVFGLQDALLWNTIEQVAFGGALSSFIDNIAKNSTPGATYVFESDFTLDMKLTKSMKKNLLYYAFWLCVYIYEDKTTDLRNYLLDSRYLP
jgi:hypothetical protein